MLHGIFGGVHPAGRKKATRGGAVAPMEKPPSQVVLPLAGPGGTPAEALAAPGDTVAVGTRLSEGGPRLAAVHASVSGTVLAVEPRVQTWGEKVLSVVIENDGKGTAAPPDWDAADETAGPGQCKPGELMKIIRRAGVAGMGGACFPAYAKLQSAMGHVDVLILNGAECEPYVSADHRLMLERPEAVLGGGRLLMRILGLEGAFLAVEGDKYDAVSALQALLPLRGGDIQVRSLRARYPQGAERQLVARLTGRKVPDGGLPSDVGCVVFNVQTAAAVYDAVYRAKPVTSRIVTVAGGAVAEPKNLLVPIGTPLKDLIEAAGGWAAGPERVVVGGPMMGQAQFDLSAPVGKGTGAVLGLTRAEVKQAAAPEGPCLRCGRCVDACPMGLAPAYLHLYADGGRARELEKLRINACNECGACAYVCPARIRLVHSIRIGKQKLRLARQQTRGEGEA